MECKIVNNDLFLELKKVPDNTFDLIFADPPYWMRTSNQLLRVEGSEFNGVFEKWDVFKDEREYNEFTKKWLTECMRVLKPNGSIWIISGMQNVYTVGGIMQSLGFWIINDVVWHKANPTPNFHGTRLQNSHETLIWATKSKKSKYTFNYKTAKELNRDSVSDDNYKKGERKQLGSIWKIPIVNGNERLKDDLGNKLHSTQKPEELLYRIIAISSKPGDYVLDPFAGTMTTGAVAKKMGRKYYMIEKEKIYYEQGLKRISKVTTELNDIENAVYDIKPLKVTLSDMIKDSYLIKGEKFFLKDGVDKNITLCENGALLYENNEISIHDAVGKVLNDNLRKNGFDYWYVRRNKKLISIDVIRDEYRHSLKKLQKAV